jgi:uncharacterized protein YjiS (DUF1127 family)
MSANSDGLAGPDRPAATGRRPSAPGQRLVTRSRRLWRTYWNRRARRATVLMLEALDDRSLKDIGLSRSEIRPVVLGGDADRSRPYDPHWRRVPAR